MQAIHIDGNYVDIEGIDAWGANVLLDGNFIRYAHSEVTHGLQRLDELDNTDAQVGDGSIRVFGQNNIVERNRIYHGSLNGIFVVAWAENGNGAHVENNEIRYFNSTGIHSSPIRGSEDRMRILQNSISETGRDGMYVASQNSEIAYNDVFHTALINNDGGIFYTVGNAELKNIDGFDKPFAGPAADIGAYEAGGVR